MRSPAKQLPAWMVAAVLHRSLITFALFAGSSLVSAADRIDFNRDVRPILSENCLTCHGPDAVKRASGLRLDINDQSMWKGESGKLAIVLGNPDQSEMMHRITSTDAEISMPPPETGKKLTPQQIETLQQWITEGAEYKGHWAFLSPVKAAPQPTTISNWAHNPIDQYVLADIEKQGLVPNSEADKITLLRRVTFDLTGLPPTPAEVNEYLADTSPEAYEKLIDRLMSSPKYGEHMARFWLDIASYGDTHGLHLDNERSIWKYREWVINAFNTNQPYDQFTVEQLAGDLLPTPTVDQQIATGFVRCNVSTSEGGSIDEEVRVRYAVDRTERLSTVFLGLTFGCAVCHDHKFDPISQKEFYSLYSFFNSTADPAMDGNVHNTPPIVRVPSAEDTAKLADFDVKIAEKKKLIADALARVEYTEPVTAVVAATGPQEFIWVEDSTPPGAKYDGSGEWEFVSAPDHPVYSGAKSSRRQAGPAMSQHFFIGATAGLKIGEGDKLFAYVYLDPKNPPKTVMLQFNDGGWEHRAFWGDDTIAFGSGDVAGHRRVGDLPKTGEWVRLEVEAQHVGLNAGAVLNGWAFTQFDGLCYWDHAGSVTQTPQDGKGFESQLAWEAYDKALPTSAVPQPIRDAIKVEVDKRTDDQKKQIRDYFVEAVYSKTREVFEPLKKELDDLTAQRKSTDDAIPVSLVMADLPTERETFVLIRGEYDKPGDKITRGTPKILPPMPEGVPNNRLGLARWLVSPTHPLTSRVTVNRFWQQLFGRGIVKTSEDFGSQGEFPTHPELLDWLALDFQENGWNVKRLMKQMLMSSTYRQSSKVTAELAERDPENTLLARGPRFRMDAELVRDNALAIAGLLSPKIGGKSVKPYQPEGVWEAVAFVGSNTNSYKRDDGEALYRRSMYTFWKRTSPPPSLMAFDAPSRENCVARRARTNTPLQALVLLNDEQYIEAARQLAKRMLTEGGAPALDRLRFGFRLTTARDPSERELSVLSAQLAAHLEHFQADVEAAKKLLAIGAVPRDESLDPAEHAAYTLIGNLLLNLDETMTKE